VGSIGLRLEHNARHLKSAVAIRSAEETLSHGELNRRVNRTARAFARAGIRSGDAVGVLMDNRVAVFVMVGALSKLGAIAALVNTNQRGDVLTHSFTVARCAAAVVGEEHWPVFAEVSKAVKLPPDRQFWVADSPDACGCGALDTRPEAQAPPESVDLGEASFELNGADPVWTSAVRLGDPCFYIFTSGTTGLPKASVMTHMRWTKAGAAYGEAMLALSSDDCVYAPLPLYHNMALSVGWGSAATTGASLAIRRKFSASAYWSDCRDYGATALVYIGELPRYLLAATPGPGDRDHSVRAAVGVGLRPDLWTEFQERFGVPGIFETYAASEGNTIFLNAFNVQKTVGVCPTPHAIVKYDIENDEPVCDANGRLIRVGPGEAGLLLGKVTGRFDFDGYTDAKASEKKLIRGAFKDGDVWFNSGDLLRKVGWGHAEFVDRVGDTFRWKSENVATGEVENVINQVSWVAESTVYGVEVEGMEGRAGMVALTLCPGAEFDSIDLGRTLSEKLPDYAIPVFVRLRSALDVTGTFKHQKTQLKKDGWDPRSSADPVLVRAGGEYVPLSEPLRSAIQAGLQRL
jgi:acyl-CoA synthetase (AMP-forming)/AMP-acid ligase II